MGPFQDISATATLKKPPIIAIYNFLKTISSLPKYV